MTHRHPTSVVVATVGRMIIPFIQLFALYVIVHGESGPGGGFQGGVILASSIILLLVIFGLPEAKRIISERLGILLASVGLFLYAGIGLASIFFGGKYLEYDVLPLINPVKASEFGIIFVEIGIGITVMAVMVLILYFMATGGQEE